MSTDPDLLVVESSMTPQNLGNAILSSFADDTKVWKAGDGHMGRILLQDDLDMIYEWAANNNMQFNSVSLLSCPRVSTTMTLGN